MKDIIFQAEVNDGHSLKRRDGNIRKINFVAPFDGPGVAALRKVYGKTVDISFALSDTVTIGETVAEFVRYDSAHKADGNVQRIGFVTRHDSEIAQKVDAYLGESLTITVSADGSQGELFPEAEPELNDEDPDALEFDDEPDLGEEG